MGMIRATGPWTLPQQCDLGKWRRWFTRPKVVPGHSHSTLLALRSMLRPMTERTETTGAQEPSAAAEPPYGRDRWHRRGRPFRFAAMVVALAGIVFIIAVIFWSGSSWVPAAVGHHGHHWAGSRHASMSSLYAPEWLQRALSPRSRQSRLAGVVAFVASCSRYVDQAR